MESHESRMPLVAFFAPDCIEAYEVGAWGGCCSAVQRGAGKRMGEVRYTEAPARKWVENVR